MSERFRGHSFDDDGPHDTEYIYHKITIACIFCYKSPDDWDLGSRWSFPLLFEWRERMLSDPEFDMLYSL